MSSVPYGTDLNVAVITGSVREGRFGPLVASWVHKNLADDGISAEVVDLADLSIPHTMTAHDDVTALASAVGRADAIVLITPEYNHSYPGPLKTAIDAVKSEWQAKPIGFVSYGGMAGGLRAVEALRPVFAELHAVTIRECVSLHNPWGPASDPAVEYPSAESTVALKRLVRQLLWWGDAMRAARERNPYPTD